MSENVQIREITPRIPSESPYERKLNEYARALIANMQAVQDYNIMMGYIDDPTAEEMEGEK